jgi:hypothetical protein
MEILDIDNSLRKLTDEITSSLSMWKETYKKILKINIDNLLSYNRLDQFNSMHKLLLTIKARKLDKPN